MTIVATCPATNYNISLPDSTATVDGFWRYDESVRAYCHECGRHHMHGVVHNPRSG